MWLNVAWRRIPQIASSLRQNTASQARIERWMSGSFTVASGIETSSAPSVTSISLRWFLRLRWMAAFGQATSILVAHFHFGLDLPWLGLMAVLVATIFSNHWFQGSADWSEKKSGRRLALVIVADLLLLTLMLYFTGGIHNPFVGFYLLLIAMGAMTLSAKALGYVLMLSIAGLIWISLAAIPFKGPVDVVSEGHLAYPLFIRAWVVSLFLIGGCIAFFVRRMNASLKERDVALVGAEKRILEANRYQSLATLAAGVAHELGSPLGTIAIASKDLLRDLKKSGADSAAQEDALLIRSEVERCRVILKRLDQESTRSTGEALQPCSVDELTGKLTALLPDGVNRRLEISDETAGRKWMTSVQAVLQSLVVLIENACEADTTSGKVRLIARIEDDRNLVFQVVDTGRGITEAERRRIGQPFYTTKKNESGMGLGLFLVQTLTTNLGGSCTLHPNIGGGTCATLILPLQPDEMKSP